MSSFNKTKKKKLDVRDVLWPFCLSTHKKIPDSKLLGCFSLISKCKWIPQDAVGNRNRPAVLLCFMSLPLRLDCNCLLI